MPFYPANCESLPDSRKQRLSELLYPDQNQNQRKAEFKNKSVNTAKPECAISRAAKTAGHGIGVAAKATVSLFSRAISVVTNAFIWLAENRLGVAKLLGE
ncbi:MAG: hypothetical protein ACPGEF_04770, partial [Endozoicomonas sp.]